MTAVRTEIDCYPLNLAAQVLDISVSTLRRWANKLREAGIEELNHLPYSQVVPVESMGAYQKLKQLRDKGFPLEQAIEKIKFEGY